MIYFPKYVKTKLLKDGKMLLYFSIPYKYNSANLYHFADLKGVPIPNNPKNIIIKINVSKSTMNINSVYIAIESNNCTTNWISSFMDMKSLNTLMHVYYYGNN